MSEASATAQEKTKPKRVRRHQVGVVKGMRIRIYPTQEQQQLLIAWMGACRWTWNWALGRQNNHYRQTGKHLSTTALSRDLTAMMKAGIEPMDGKDITWLVDVPRTSLTCVLNSLKTSWTAFFDGCSGKRKDKPGKPQFQAYRKAKKSISFQVDHRHANRINTASGNINFPGVGKIDAVFSETVPGDLAKLTITRQGGQWFAALGLINVPVEAARRLTDWQDLSGEGEVSPDPRFRQFENPLDPEGFAAFDASVVFGAVATSDGKSVYCLSTEEDRKRADEKRAKKKRYQKKLSRKQKHRQAEYNVSKGKRENAPLAKGVRLPQSNRQRKIADKIAKIDLHLKNAKKDQTHKFTTSMVRENHTIVGETLLIRAMAKSLNKGFRRRLHEASMGEIFRQLEYKCAWHGRTFIKVDRWFASSKRCSNPECHKKNFELKLSDRAWVCPHCQSSWERDANSAFNLWQEGQRLAALSQENQTEFAHAVGYAVGSAVNVRQVSNGLDTGGSDLPPVLEAVDTQGAEYRPRGVVPSVNRKQHLALSFSGCQKPETDLGKDTKSGTAE